MSVGQTEAWRVHERAKEISGTGLWKKILDTIERRVSFEDGYLRGWMDSKRHYIRKYRKHGQK